MSTNPAPVSVTVPPSLVALFSTVENFVRKSGMWAIIINDFTKTFHVTGSYGLNSVLTAIAGSLIYSDHQAKKAASAAATVSAPPAA